jgi:hypothetical protein
VRKVVERLENSVETCDDPPQRAESSRVSLRLHTAALDGRSACRLDPNSPACPPDARCIRRRRGSRYAAKARVEGTLTSGSGVGAIYRPLTDWPWRLETLPVVRPGLQPLSRAWSSRRTRTAARRVAGWEPTCVRSDPTHR